MKFDHNFFWISIDFHEFALSIFYHSFCKVNIQFIYFINHINVADCYVGLENVPNNLHLKPIKLRFSCLRGQST